MTGVLRRLLAAGTAAFLLTGCAVTVLEEQPTVAAPSTGSSTHVVAPTATSAAPSPSDSAPDEVEGYRAAAGLEIESVRNFRDVSGGGAGLPLADGSRMAVGVVFRSGKLAPLSRADKARLVEAGLSDIYDLRTPTVMKRTPDPTIKDAERHEANVFAVETSDPVRPASVAEARDHMRMVNRHFVSIPAQREAIASVLESIADDRGPVLLHCTEGKDRTGWISAVLQLIAGANERAVIQEYLVSNTYRVDLIEHEVAKAKRSGGKRAGEIRRALLRVDASYLEAGLDEMKSRFGDLDGYLTEGLGLSEEIVETLRTRLRAG